MELDFTTVVATAAFVAGMSGAFLLVAGGQLQQAQPTTIWGVANIFIAIGMMLVMQGREYDLALLMLMTAGSLTWIAVARFNKRTVPLVFLVTGLAVWAIMSLGPWDLTFGVKASAFLAMSALYFGACAVELWGGREEPLPGRWPVLSLVVMAAFAAMVGAFRVWSFDVPPELPQGSALWLVYVTTIAFTVGTAVFFVAMTKERTVAFHALASLTDSLTGLANRAALMASGTAEIAEAQMSGKAVAVVLFDLDHFKEVNDTYGHRVGDAVLRQFADVAVSCIRASDLIGRIGGEEFAAVIPGVGAEGALAFAERVRKAFAGSTTLVDGKPVKGTVSAGVAVASADTYVQGLEEILEWADEALYVAKAAGRDCVSLYTEPRRHELDESFLPVLDPPRAPRTQHSN
jgi:diguanylate cyclase (GGDEF)-like protein